MAWSTLLLFTVSIILALHYSDVIMSATASQITCVSIVYLTICSGTDQRKHQSSASPAFVKGIHQGPVNSPHKGPVTRNKANLRDLIAATSLEILLKIGFKSSIFPCDLQIWWMTLKNNRAPLLYYIKLCASCQTHWWIQTGFTCPETLNLAQNQPYLSLVTLKFDGWPRKTIGHLFSQPSVNSNWSYNSENPNLDQNQ